MKLSKTQLEVLQQLSSGLELHSMRGIRDYKYRYWIETPKGENDLTVNARTYETLSDAGLIVIKQRGVLGHIYTISNKGKGLLEQQAAHEN